MKGLQRRAFLRAAGRYAVSIALVRASNALAQEATYPARPVHLIVSFPAGTGVDALARLVGGRLATVLGQPVVIDNRPGAAGNIGTTAAARAAPDGHTLAIVGAAVTINTTLYGSRAVDPVSAFAPIIQLTTQPIVIVAHPSLEASSLVELVALARRKPGSLAYSTPGIGTPTHIAAELLALAARVEWMHVPYAGTGALLTDVISGEVPVAFTLVGSAEPYLKSGQVKAIAVTTNRRIEALPNVPTVAESGFPEFEITSWHGVVAPAGTPAVVVDRLAHELAKIVEEPEVVARLRALGMEPFGGTSEAFRSRIVSEAARWKDVIDRARIAVVN